MMRNVFPILVKHEFYDYAASKSLKIYINSKVEDIFLFYLLRCHVIF